MPEQEEERQAGEGPSPVDGNGRAEGEDPLPTTSAGKALARALLEVASSKYAFTDTEKRRLNLILGVYEGTHDFHNFTTEADGGTPQAQRTVRQAFCERGPVLCGVDYVRIVFVGNSFMLHQIRKMVGLTLAVARRAAPPQCIRASLDAHRNVHVPMAPPSGLLLDEPFYDQYNKQFGATHGPVSLEPFRAAATAFKEQHIYPHVGRADPRELARFLQALTEATFGFSKWPAMAAAPPARGGGKHRIGGAPR